jgi:hypothetical protein
MFIRLCAVRSMPASDLLEALETLVKHIEAERLKAVRERIQDAIDDLDDDDEKDDDLGMAP